MLLQLVIVVVVCLPGLASAGCSYDDTGLVDWNSASAWTNGVPGANEYAVITTGKHVRLNVSPPNLKGIKIETGASLVWGNFDNLVVTTDYILINGAFTVGDSDCPFTKKAHIKLTGKSNTNNTVSHFGMKFIGVGVNGTLELHGAVKKSWTRLIQTVPAALKTCGKVFNFKDSLYNDESSKGLFVMAFNLDGSMFDFGVFKTQSTSEVDARAEDNFKDFVEDIPDNKILVIAVNGDLGTGTVTTRDWEKIYTTVESVGGLASTDLRNVQGREAYAFITKTGNSSTTKEEYIANTFDKTSYSTNRLTLNHAATDLEFSVVGTVFNSSRTNKALDIRVMTREVAYPKLKLNDDVTSWNTGDRCVVASTDYNWRQVEEFTIIDCSDCQENEVRVDHAFEYMHYGEITYGVPERAEVGMLTQSILIEGIMEDECYVYDDKDQELCDIFHEDTHGGHLKVIRNFAAAHIEHVELYHLGQQKFLGRYATHFHMCDDVLGNWFRSLSIHHSWTRCTTIHGTDRAEVTNITCYLTKGHSMFLEDSAEQENIVEGNLVIGTEHGTLLLSDRKKDWVNDTLKPFTDALSSFWLTHPNNYIRKNVVAGSDNAGFWYLVASEPLGPSKQRQKERGNVTAWHAFHSKILEFNDNVAHSCAGRGLRMDDRISIGEVDGGKWVPENGVFGVRSAHSPRDPPRDNGTRVTSYMRRFVAYKNNNQNIWTKGGSIVMEEFLLADSPLLLSMARSIDQTFAEIRNSSFIGETDNIGEPKAPWGRSMPNADMLQGIVFYQGPGYVTDCFFDKFTHKYSGSDVRPAGAVSFRKSNTYPSAPNGGVSGIVYGFCDTPDTNWVFQGNASFGGFDDTDGNIQANFHDYDGSVTGTAGTQVVQSDRFFTTDRCSHRPDWNVHVCPHEYARALFEGKGGAFDKTEYSTYMIRDDRPNDTFALLGQRGDNYFVMKNMSYTVYFNGTTPNDIEVIGENLELGDYLRVGLCLPSDANFTFSSDFLKINITNPAIKVNNITALDSDTTGMAYFWDQSAGLLFVKVIGFSPVLNKEKCPGRTCPSIKVTITGGTLGVIDCYQAAYGSNTYTKQEDTTSPIPIPPACSTSTHQGYGFTPDPSNYPTGTFNPTCPSVPPAPASVYKGCFKDVASYPDLPYARLKLSQSMTIDFCVSRCNQRNYSYAALQNGFTCSCGHFYGGHGELPNDCVKPCKGKSSEVCGAANRNSVYSTGIVTSNLTACGPQNAGGIINNKCYYLTTDAVAYTDGQRACYKLGGNLATITSAEIQNGVEQYMRSKTVDAWFGLNDIESEGTLKYVDNTPVGSYNKTMEGQGDTANQDGYIVQADTLYAWNDLVVSETKQALCEMDINAQAPSGVTCGTGNFGNKFGSGSCYAVLNTQMNREDAEYACYTRLGSLVTVNSANKDDVMKHIWVYGGTMDYWTGEVDAGVPYELDFETLYTKTQTTNSTMNGVICEIETLSASNPCSEGWSKYNSNCYLYTAISAETFTKSLSLCQQGASDILMVHSKGENDYVSQLVNNITSTHVYIGFKYNATSETYEWIDGSAASYTNWRSGQGDSNTDKGKCARIRTKDGTWKNRVCTNGDKVVCKTPAGQ